MNSKNHQFFTVQPKQDIVVFIIGMKVRKSWRIWTWLPVYIQMFGILRELKSSPQKGLLHTITLPSLLIQYWESYDHLYDYASDSKSQHLGVWKLFNKNVKKTGAIGVFHETYVVPSDRIETAYHNMPPIGLSAFCEMTSFSKGTMTARQRLGVAANQRVEKLSERPIPNIEL